MQLAEVTIAPRFCRPAGAGNGGYVAGLVASFAAEPVEVRLRLPQPLGVPLGVHAREGGALELRAGSALLASATPAALELEVPAAVPADAARAAEQHYLGHRSHPEPGCFVCGPARMPGDGLRLFPGGVIHEGVPRVAATWRPDASLAGTRDRVRPEFISAALDCPGYFALMSEPRPALLGSLTCRIDGAVAVGEPCVVVGWRLGGEGRKHRAATALYGAAGRCVARARAVWIEPRTAG